MSQQAKTLSDGADSVKQQQYRDLISRAKEKSGAGQAPPLSNVPRFDQLPKDAPQAPPGAQQQQKLSPETTQGLAAMARMTGTAPAPEAAKSAPAAEEPAAEVVEEDEEVKLRRVIEARLSPIDVGHFILSGEASQEVSIVPDQLSVVFRTATDLEETFVDLQLSKEKDLTSGRQFIRRQSEWALALHIKSVNGTEWPKVLGADGSVNKEAAEERLARARKLAGPIFTLVGQNLAWFLDRVNKALTVGALKNG